MQIHLILSILEGVEMENNSVVQTKSENTNSVYTHEQYTPSRNQDTMGP